MSTLEWKFSQVFGEGNRPVDEVADGNTSFLNKTDDIFLVDVVSAIEFDDTGEYIAVGDRGGRIVLFEREGGKSAEKKKLKNVEYKFYAEFQSHDPEFDYLKSLEIEEKINKIKWCKRQNNAHFLLSTNGNNLIVNINFTKIKLSNYGRFMKRK
jgi:serine/threonine-protein phosphatase 2A regulatory subunit B